MPLITSLCRARLKCDGTCAETRFSLPATRTGPFKSARWGRQFSRLLGSRGVRISGSNAGYTVFRGSVKGTGYPMHSPVSPSLPLPASPCAITFQLETTTGTRSQLKCDGTRSETRFRLSAKRTSPFKSATGRQFSRLLATEVCASAVVMLDTPCSEVV